jgi:Pentapeptide repeats (9 copies)
MRNWINRRWAWLEEQFGKDHVLKGPVILPTEQFFPDPYEGIEEDAVSLFGHVCTFMAIERSTVELSFYEESRPVYDGELHAGTSGLYQAHEGKFQIWIEVRNIHDPLAMVATMAHELGHVHLLGHGRISADAEDHEPLTDLLTVFFGMGVFVANAVVREKSSSSGLISAWSIKRQGYLDMRQLAFALALYARAREENNPSWAVHLRPDVFAPFKQSIRFLAHPESSKAPECSDLAGSVMQLSANLQEPGDDDLDPYPQEFDLPKEAITREGMRRRIASGDRDFMKADLHNLDLSNSDLHGCNLAGADFSDANLTDCSLEKADMHDADLQGTVLRKTNLRGSNLLNADLTDAVLEGADLSGADIRSAEFTGAIMHGANLTATLRNHETNLSGVDLSQVICDSDLSNEDLRGEFLSEKQAAWQESLNWWTGFLMITGIAFLVSFGTTYFVVWVVAAMFGAKNEPEFVALVVALIATVIVDRRFFKQRKQ